MYKQEEGIQVSLNSILDQMYVLPILLFSVVVHEVAHGRVALWRGDPTAKEMGRLTLDPIPHIDLVGSILVPLFSIIAAGSVFIAWAKPVPVNPLNFRNPRRDDILVSVAGPVSNFLMAGVCTLAVALMVWLENLAGPDAPQMAQTFMEFVAKSFLMGITMNVVLAVFNLIPVPPLDGSHVLASLLPAGIGERFRSIGFLGIFLVIFLMRVPIVEETFSGIIHILVLPYVIMLQVLT